MAQQHKIKIFSCRSSRYLAEKIVKALDMELGKSSVTLFSDGEFQPAFEESVRGSTVFIIQSTIPPVENIFELLLMIDAARRASAYKVIAVIPYFGWARQDRKDRPRVPIGAKMVANLLAAAGCDRVMTADLHADQIQGFFDFPVDHIYASSIFLPYLRELNLDNLSIAAPDMGGAKRANAYSRILGCPLVICHKSREKANVVGEMTAIGDVEGRNIVIIDDMIDTAGTITKAADMLMDKGACSVRALATHAVLSGPAFERIAASRLIEVVITDTIPMRPSPEKDFSKIRVLTVSDIFAEIINKVNNYQSISSSFIF
ncbi:MAG: ribose-phosphate pyrophosphokinase [Bacteroidales bacterium]